MSVDAMDLGHDQLRTPTDDSVSPSHSSRLNSPGPLPLPSFVFPARESFPEPITGSRSAPSSFSRASGRRQLSAIETRSKSKDRASGEGEQLPAFSFGSPSLETPQISPSTIPARPSNVSEFLGSDGMTGAGVSVSTSPTKSEGAFPHTASSFGTPGGRRGHAHRRSAAISVGDLTFILKPNASNTRGASAPPTPSAVQEHHPRRPGSVDAALQLASSRSDIEDPENSPRMFKNTRVGFSDEVSIIPRPLSVVSSDSSSTVRPGHSVSNSLSSVMSGGASSPSSKEKRFYMPSTTRVMDVRPRTAEPILDRDQLDCPNTASQRRGSLSLVNDLAAESAPSTPRSAKKWSFFGHESASGESSPRSRPTSAASSAKESKKAETAPSSPELTSPDVPIESMEVRRTSSRRSSISRKPSKNKKVKSWAGSILSRKSRHRKPKLSRRSPTPPLRSYTPAAKTNDFDFDAPEPPSSQRLQVQTDFTNWKPRKLPPQEDSMSPIIDLDAALGPFNTPSSFGDDWDMSQKNGKKKRAMHSAAGLCGFSGPGMHYHRRTESAPEFENPRFGLSRLGSSSTMGMEDVFEEDEDEEWEDAKTPSVKETSSKKDDVEIDVDANFGIDIKVVDSNGTGFENPMDSHEAAFQHGVKRNGGEERRRNMSSSKSAHSTTSLVDDPIQEESGPVEIVDDSVPPRPDSRAQSSDSTATPSSRPRPAKDLAPVEIQPFSSQLALQPPFHTPSTPRSASQASFPSPRSPFSYDTQRISTAPSSFTDENAFQSLLMGEPGPELRVSVDDVPSLSSSNSTTKDNSGNYPIFRENHRSASLSSATVGRKRSSMVSLSRLISSSHGEKSKLSIESTPQTATGGEKKEKKSTGKRISNMIQFWKHKEPGSAAS